MITQCPHCGKEGIKNQKLHERFCKSNPNKSQSSSSSFSKSLQQPPSTPAAHDTLPEKKPIIITDVQQYISDDYTDGLVAWFDDGEGNRLFKVPVLSGIMHNENELIPVVLLPTVDGMFLPPFMCSGFIGMYPRNQVFPEAPQPDTTEPFPPFAEEELTPIIKPTEPIKNPTSNELMQDRHIIPPGEPAKEEKTSFLQTLGFGKKKKEPESNIADLLKELNNAKST